MQNIAMTAIQRVVVGCVFVGKYTAESKHLIKNIIFCFSANAFFTYRCLRYVFCMVCLCRSVLPWRHVFQTVPLLRSPDVS